MQRPLKHHHCLWKSPYVGVLSPCHASTLLIVSLKCLNLELQEDNKKGKASASAVPCAVATEAACLRTDFHKHKELCFHLFYDDMYIFLMNGSPLGRCAATAWSP